MKFKMELCEQQMEEVRGRREVEITQLDGKLQVSLLPPHCCLMPNFHRHASNIAIIHFHDLKKCQIKSEHQNPHKIKKFHLKKFD